MAGAAAGLALRGSGAAAHLGTINSLSASERVALFLVLKPVHKAFCIAGILSSLVAMLVDPSSRFVFILFGIFFLLVLTSRLAVSGLQDQQRALDLFGVSWCVVFLGETVAYVLMNMEYQFCVNMPDQAVWAINVHHLLSAMYLQLNGVGDVTRCVCHVGHITGLYLSESACAMPHEHCVLHHALSTFAGEVVGVHFARIISRWIGASPAGLSALSTPIGTKQAAPGAAEAPDGVERDVATEGGATLDEMLDGLVAGHKGNRSMLVGNILTLCFDDPAAEMLYAANTFASSHRMHDLACASAVVACAIGVHASHYLRLAGMLYAGFFSLAWYSHHRLRAWRDVPFAHVTFCHSWERSVWLTAGLFLLGTLLPLVDDRLLVDLLSAPRANPHAGAGQVVAASAGSGGMAPWPSDGEYLSVVSGAFLLTLMGAYHRLALLPPDVRMSNRCVLFAAVLHVNIDRQTGLLPTALPNFALAACLLLLGELIGYSVDHVRRWIFREWLVAAWAAAATSKETTDQLARIEASAQELRRKNELHMAEIAADKRLNHVIKGRCGSACSAIDLYRDMIRPHLALLQHPPPEEITQLLVDSERHLQEAIEWCHRRQVFVQLEEGTYVSRPTKVDVNALLGSHLTQADSLYSSVSGEVEVDETVLKITLDEIFSNALKYRKKCSALTVRAGHVQGSLRVEVSNINKPGQQLLTPDECERVMQPGYKAHACSAMSDGLGLDSASKAVGAVRGTVALTQEPTTTTLHLSLPAVLGGYLSEDSTASPLAEEPVSPAAAGAIEADSSIPQQKLIPSWATVPLFRHAKPNSLPPPTCVGLSCEDAAAGFLHRLFGLLGAGKAAVLDPASAEDDFIGHVVGHETVGGEAIPPANVAILQGAGSWMARAGTAERLRALGYVGVVCLHMPRASEEELAWARMHPSVDMVLHGSHEEELTRAAHGILTLLRHGHRQQSPDDAEGSTGSGGSGSGKPWPVQRVASGPELRLAAAIAPTGASTSLPRRDAPSADETTGVYATPATAPWPCTAAAPVAAGPPAPPRPEVSPGGLRAFGLDDEMIPRRILGLFMEHHLKADMEASATFGRTEEEMTSFLDVTMGVLNRDLTANTRPAKQADVVLLDENILPPKILGSLLAAELRERGFTGVVVILTGASASHISLLSAIPGVDLVFDKGASLPRMGEEVRRILREKNAGPAEPR